jgi:hypothetical protein
MREMQRNTNKRQVKSEFKQMVYSFFKLQVDFYALTFS